MRTKNVVVLPYDPGWEAAFLRIKAPLCKALSPWLSSIEHVGSTSVPGMWAKPVIDLDLVLRDDDCFFSVREQLRRLGYFHEGDLGIPGREAFAYENTPELMTHHLYVCPPNSPELRRHLAFRDYLRTHPEQAEQYSLIKRQAASLFPQDIDGYMAMKAPCIRSLYRQCGLL